MKKLLTISIFIFLAITFSCKKEKVEETKYKPTPYSIRVPAHFPVPEIPTVNPMTVEGVTLGKKFYYDPILSSNGLTCSSCHIANRSFSIPLFINSTGDYISVPPHVNLAWNPDYNWNGSEPKLDHLCIADFGPDFFDTDMDKLVLDLKAHAEYPDMIYKAFGVTDVAQLTHDELKQTIVYSISQFMRSMVSADSKFDKYFDHQVGFTASEQSGYMIFMTERGDCFHCHGNPLFTSNDFRNNGLDCTPQGANSGRYLVTGNANDIGKFSVPTLRNVELTAPYMHDGRYATLEEVVEFYNSGVCMTSPNIDPIMTKPAKEYGLNLWPWEKEDLVNFLKTLTDTTFINNPDFTNQ
ncbi:MAG: cytochrome-c peroxidase [Bacteroidia bacterium]|nr:cytochrome-c peroxidase [Bacteroidia bacterium]